MIIRQSTIQDLPEIVALLKLSIGETLTPKTETYFSWKHEQNPFGRSKVLLWIENGKIVGLRAFMHWRWVSASQQILAVRAVDTATDPAFQGKGIFKKLTLQAVEECKAEGVHMVFNSPNPISMQGYLKMGWSEAGRLPLYLGIGSLLPRTYSDTFVNSIYDEYTVSNVLKTFPQDWSIKNTDTVLYTPLDRQFLQWRYCDCPVAKYGAVAIPGKFGFIFRIKKLKGFMELRICEAWTEDSAEAEKLARAAFKKLLTKLKPFVISSADTPLYLSGNRKIGNFYGPLKKGPVITIRPLAMENLNNFAQFNNWQPSLGSMELF